MSSIPEHCKDCSLQKACSIEFYAECMYGHQEDYIALVAYMKSKKDTPIFETRGDDVSGDDTIRAG